MRYRFNCRFTIAKGLSVIFVLEFEFTKTISTNPWSHIPFQFLNAVTNYRSILETQLINFKKKVAAADMRPTLPNVNKAEWNAGILEVLLTFLV